MQVHSPIVSGSGVAVLHHLLQDRLEGYRVQAFPPRLGLFPPAARWLAAPPPVPVTHSIPDLGPWIAHPDSALVTTFHGYYLDREYRRTASLAQQAFYNTMLRFAVARALARARVVTTVSHFLGDLVQREWQPGKRLVVIRNGIDTQHFQPAAEKPHDGLRILFTGNPTASKGFAHLNALAGELPEGSVIRYTQGMREGVNPAPSDNPRLQALPRRQHADMPGLYQDSDIFFFPTRREGFGLAVVEAMACGLPVVATRCSALPELVDHGRGGFLFEPGNRREMMDYLARLARDPEQRRDMGRYNREKVLKEFTVERMAEEYRQLFSSLA